MGDSISYVWELVFLCLGVSNSYVLGLGILTFGGLVLLRLGFSNSNVWGYFFLRLRVRDSYVLGLVILTFGG